MLSAIKILFISISVLFSFGFTINESKCLDNKKSIEELHSCCKKIPLEEKAPCDGNCCQFPIAYYSFSEFEINHFSVKQSVNVIVNTNVFIIIEKEIDSEKLTINSFEYLNFKQEYPDISEYQSWLV